MKVDELLGKECSQRRGGAAGQTQGHASSGEEASKGWMENEQESRKAGAWSSYDLRGNQICKKE